MPPPNRGSSRRPYPRGEPLRSTSNRGSIRSLQQSSPRCIGTHVNDQVHSIMRMVAKEKAALRTLKENFSNPAVEQTNGTQGTGPAKSNQTRKQQEEEIEDPQLDRKASELPISTSDNNSQDPGNSRSVSRNNSETPMEAMEPLKLHTQPPVKAPALPLQKEHRAHTVVKITTLINDAKSNTSSENTDNDASASQSMGTLTCDGDGDDGEDDASSVHSNEDSVKVRTMEYGTKPYLEEMFRNHQSAAESVKPHVVTTEFFTGKGRNNNQEIFFKRDITMSALSASVGYSASTIADKWDTRARRPVCQQINSAAADNYSGPVVTDYAAQDKPLDIEEVNYAIAANLKLVGLRKKHDAVKAEERKEARRLEKLKIQRLAPRPHSEKLENIQKTPLSKLASPLKINPKRPQSAPFSPRPASPIKTRAQAERVPQPPAGLRPSRAQSASGSRSHNAGSLSNGKDTLDPPRVQASSSPKNNKAVGFVSHTLDGRREEIDEEDDCEDEDVFNEDHPLNSENWSPQHSIHRHRLMLKRRAMLGPRVKDAEENLLRAKGLYKPPVDKRENARGLREKFVRAATLLQVVQLDASSPSIEQKESPEAVAARELKEREQQRLTFRNNFIEYKKSLQDVDNMKPFAWLNTAGVTFDNESLGMCGGDNKQATMHRGSTMKTGPNQAMILRNELEELMVKKHGMKVYFVNHGDFISYDTNEAGGANCGAISTDTTPDSDDEHIDDGGKQIMWHNYDAFYKNMYHDVLEKLHSVDDDPVSQLGFVSGKRSFKGNAVTSGKHTAKRPASGQAPPVIIGEDATEHIYTRKELQAEAIDTKQRARKIIQGEESDGGTALEDTVVIVDEAEDKRADKDSAVTACELSRIPTAAKFKMGVPVLKRSKKRWNHYSFLTKDLQGLENMDIESLMEVLLRSNKDKQAMLAEQAGGTGAGNALMAMIKTQDGNKKPNKVELSMELMNLFQGFSKLDCDRDSLLSVDDLRQYCDISLVCQKDISDVIMEELIFMLDDQQRGSVTFDEVKNYYLRLKPQFEAIVATWQTAGEVERENERQASIRRAMAMKAAAKKKKKGGGEKGGKQEDGAKAANSSKPVVTSNNNNHKVMIKNGKVLIRNLEFPRVDYLPFLLYRLLMYASLCTDIEAGLGLLPTFQSLVALYGPRKAECVFEILFNLPSNGISDDSVSLTEYIRQAKAQAGTASGKIRKA